MAESGSFAVLVGGDCSTALGCLLGWRQPRRSSFLQLCGISNQ